MNKDPLNISLLDIDQVIKDEHLQEVTSEFIKESSTNRFHPEGLFSEQIFGEVASQKRLETCGYIKLNCRVFHPIVYQNLQSIRRFYVEIMAGTTYAVWDADAGDFVRASETERGADTGFTFFLKHFDQINFTKNLSLKRGDKIDVITKFKKLRLIDKLIVIPAGERDMKEDQGRMEKDSINSLYSSLLRNAKSMTKGADTNPLFDSVHYTIQKRVVEIYEHVADLVRGKRGFLEGKYLHRNIARGTRNVITATDMDASSPESLQFHRCDETKVPLYQAAKAGANYLVYWYKTLFYDQILNMSSENVPLINQKTLQLEYVPLELKDKDRMMTAEGIEKTIDRFRDPHNRFKPVIAVSGKTPYYVFMVYDRGDRINVIRNVDEFKRMMRDEGLTFDEKLLRPLTQAEMLYLAAFFAYKGTHATNTRYPVLDEQNIFISKTHLMTTSPSRVVRWMQNVKDDPTDQILPEYPILGNKFIDAIMLHPTRLKSLGADFDGNCLVGETMVEIRYTDNWFKTCCQMMRSVKLNTDQCILHALNDIDASVYAMQAGWNYAEIRMDQLPQLGEYQVDKNGARVYEVPDGIEVLSYRDGSPTYMPIEKLTVEDDCYVSDIIVAGRTATVSTNKSLAVFNHHSGCLEKVSPGCSGDRWIPYFKTCCHWNFNDNFDFKNGYDFALTNGDLSEINSYLLRAFNTSCLSGYFAAIVDKFGRIQRDNTSLGITVMFEITKKEDVDGLRKLLYVLGLRFDYVTNKDVCMIVLNGNDIIHYTDLHFRNKMNNVIYYTWLQDNFSKHRSSDPIPLTQSECNRIGSLISQKFGYEKALEIKKNHVAERHILKCVIDKNENTSLSQRVYNDNVCWSRAIVTRLSEKRRVYDFIVPETKVFAVNNGLIVFDTCSWIPIFSEEANRECETYIHTPGNYVLPSGDTLADMCDDLTKIAFFAMTRDTPGLKK